MSRRGGIRSDRIRVISTEGKGSFLSEVAYSWEISEPMTSTRIGSRELQKGISSQDARGELSVTDQHVRAKPATGDTKMKRKS